MFIAITTEDFDTFVQNNEGETWNDFTNKTDYPIFTGMTVEETRNRVENYFHVNCAVHDDIPEYEICEITTKAIVKGAYKLNVSCDYLNS